MRPRELARRVRARRAGRRLAAHRLLAAFAQAHPHAFFVEIGSNDGMQHDHLRPFILSRPWRGIMVEPVPYVFERLRENYAGLADRVALERVAIADRDGTLPFFHLSEADAEERAALPDWYDGIGSFSRDAVLSHAAHIPDIEERLVCKEVPALTFASLCERHGVERVDLLLIDAEGHDWRLIRTIDLERHCPRLLIYEHYHLSPPDRAACRAHLEHAGYETMEEGFDTFCLRADEEVLRRTWSRLRPGLPAQSRADEEDERYPTSLHDGSVPLPEGAEERLRPDNPRLRELQDAYAALRLPVLSPSRWHDDAVESFLDLRWFRGETLITWHYRETPRIDALKYFALMQYVRGRDRHGLLAKLGEDGAFGCWTYDYPGYGRVSRDLLDSVNELCFLERELALSRRERFSVLDVGAGYGRLAHRMSEAYPQLADYCCVDAIPESSFLSEYYLRERGCTPPARVVALHELERELVPGSFDLAVNIHSWSECTFEAVEWWVGLLERLRVPRLLVVPNEPDELLTLEAGGGRRDFAPLLARAGYELVTCEPVLQDQAVRELVRLEDRFHLFALTRGEFST